MSETLLANLDELLQEDVLPQIQEQFYKEYPLFSALKRNTGVTKLENGTFSVRALHAPHSGVHTQKEGGTLRTGKPTYGEMTAYARYAFAVHELSHQAIVGVTGQPGSLADVVTEFGKRAMEGLAKDVNRMFYGYGKGYLTAVNGAVSAATTITVDSTFYLYPGQRLFIGTAAEIEAGTAVDTTVDTITSSTVFESTAAVTLVDDDYVVKYDTYDTTGSAYTEMMGLAGLVDYSGGLTTTHQGITRSSYDWVNAYYDSDSEALSEDDLMTAIMEANKYGKVNLIMGNPKLQWKYASLLTGMRRIVNSLDYVGGFSGVGVSTTGGEIPFVGDHDCPYQLYAGTGGGPVYGLDTSAWTIGEMYPINWLNMGEGILKSVSGNTGIVANYRAVLCYYGNLINLVPKSNFVLTDKTT